MGAGHTGGQADAYAQAYTLLEEGIQALTQLVDAAPALYTLPDWMDHSNQWRIGKFLYCVLHPHQAFRHFSLTDLVHQGTALEEQLLVWYAGTGLDLQAYLVEVPDLSSDAFPTTEHPAMVREYAPTLHLAVQRCQEEMGVLQEACDGLCKNIDPILTDRTWALGSFMLGRVLRPALGLGVLHRAYALRQYDKFVTRLEDFAQRLEHIQTGLDALRDDLGPMAKRESIPVARTRHRVFNGMEALPDVPDAPQPVTVVVPVYNACDDVEACLESLLAHTAPTHTILCIDDCSTDEHVRPMLERYAAEHASIELLCNEQNRGFTATVNRGMQACAGDVVLLNSDTVVTARWLEKLARTAASRDDVATVTPITNSGGAFSVPELGQANELPESMTVTMMGDMVERLGSGDIMECPTGNGFCLYIRRAALEKVGYFDEKNFPRGYGEENDFCRRAAEAGMVHLIEDRTFIYHKESASFLEAKADLSKAALKTINRLHPGYDRLIQDWLDTGVLEGLRRSVRSVNRCILPVPLMSYLVEDERPTLLYLVHGGSGGVSHHLNQLLRPFTAQYRCLVLVLLPEQWTLNVYRGQGLQQVSQHDFTTPWDVKEDDAERRTALQEICTQYSPDLVHVHHLIGLAPEALSIPALESAHVLFSAHDFYSVCPAYTLLDEERQHCDGDCTPGEGDCLQGNLWLTVPGLKHQYVHTWRERFTPFLQRCDRIITFSTFAPALIQRHHSQIAQEKFVCIPHGQALDDFHDAAVPPEASRGPIRVLLLGALEPAKGSLVLEALIKLNQAAGNPFEFHFLGNLHGDFEPEQWGGVAHGAYQRSELPQLMQEIAPSFGMICSVCAETFSYTLSEYWAAGLPVLVSDIGAPKERVEATGAGWVLDHCDPEAWFQRMQDIAGDAAGYDACREKVIALQQQSESAMVAAYGDLYTKLLKG